MNKKVVILVSAVLAFFAGAIWVSEVPVVATLVAFLEICAGFGCGFFYHKTFADEAVTKLTNEVSSMQTTQNVAAEEKKIRVRTTTKKKAPKTASK